MIGRYVQPRARDRIVDIGCGPADILEHRPVCLANLYTLNTYNLDWLKQLAIRHELTELKSVRDAKGSAIFFVDDATDLNAQGRAYRFYELSGFLRRAFGDETRFGTLLKQCQGRNSFNSFKGEGYNVRDYNGGDMAGVVTIARGEAKPGAIEAALAGC